jgi:hypothetical protein
MKKPDVAQKVQEVYKDLVNSIPSNQFGESDTKEIMLQGYYRAKKSSSLGLLKNAEDVMTKVRAMSASIKRIGTPLSDIPSGKSLGDVRFAFIVNKYKEQLGPVSKQFIILYCIPAYGSNCHYSYCFGDRMWSLIMSTRTT